MTVDKQFFIETNGELNINATNQLSMFMPNMRFNSNNISYSFVECSDYSQTRMKQAFQIISNETNNIYFYENRLAQIIIYCSQQREEKRNSTFVAGEGGPDNLINLSLYPLINSGKIYLYEQKNNKDCSYPIVELHELMHVFGFDHINDSSKILYPYISCKQRITPDITTELNKIYSKEPKADLTLQNLSANTHGNYLDFNITILNRGLISSINVSLDILNGEKIIDSITIEDLSPGISQIMTVKNIVIKTNNLNQIKFKVTSDSEEYFYENNQLTATVN